MPCFVIYAFKVSEARCGLVAAVPRTFLNGWSTTSRFHADIEDCRFWVLEHGDAQVHCLACVVMRRLPGSALGRELHGVVAYRRWRRSSSCNVHGCCDGLRLARV